MSVLTYLLLLVCVCACKTAQIPDGLRIIGGNPVKIEDAPYMAQFRIVRGYDHHCGASIVHEQFLITAGHCYKNDTEFYATVGTDKVNEGQNLDIEKMIRHPNFNESGHDYDVTVVKLKQKLIFNEKIQPIKMADPNIVIEDGAIVTTLGFGGDWWPFRGASPILLGVDAPVVNQKTCANFFKHLTDKMICAGGKDKHSCYGDSGGPLVYNNTLVGIVSYGDSFCGDEDGSPGVYARVSALRDFIDNAIKSNL